jgi:hypothetical protein
MQALNAKHPELGYKIICRSETTAINVHCATFSLTWKKECNEA